MHPCFEVEPCKVRNNHYLVQDFSFAILVSFKNWPEARFTYLSFWFSSCPFFSKSSIKTVPSPQIDLAYAYEWQNCLIIVVLFAAVFFEVGCKSHVLCLSIISWDDSSFVDGLWISVMRIDCTQSLLLKLQALLVGP